jgi:hypothetical protein
MEFDEATRNMCAVIKYAVMDGRPDGEMFGVDDPYNGVLLMVANVALNGAMYEFELMGDDGKAETLSIGRLNSEDSNDEHKAALQIWSSKSESELEKRFTTVVEAIFKRVNS